MATNNDMQFVKDLPNKKIIVTRFFNAPPEKVWSAWTESALLEQWWAPKPYKARTKSMDFSVGGRWLYAMVGPDNSEMWCKVEFAAIDAPKSFEVRNMFCDEDGNTSGDHPAMYWKNAFEASGSGTKVIIDISFETTEALEQIIAMGFQEGFTAALGNLDELFA